MKCPRWLPRALTPIYRIRGHIVSRTFTHGPSRFPDHVVRLACERILDAVEMWQMRPAFEAMQKQQDEIDAVNRKLAALCAEFGIDMNDDRRSDTASTEEPSATSRPR